MDKLTVEEKLEMLHRFVQLTSIWEDVWGKRPISRIFPDLEGGFSDENLMMIYSSIFR